MTAIRRQNTLFVSEDWIRVYEAIQNVDFRAYDHDNYVKAIMTYINQHHPDKFNDWIASSELVMKIEVLTWLSQNLSYRNDLNSRENFMGMAERRNSILLLAQNVAYRANRVKSATGDVKITSIQTDQPLVDLDGIDLRNRPVVWNDASNENWLEQFTIVVNAALTIRTPFGKPVASFAGDGIEVDQYVTNSISPDSGSYTFNAEDDTSGVIGFELYNSDLDPDTGAYQELDPGTRRPVRLFYKQDGNGYASPDTGFFFPIKQGTLFSQDEAFDTPISVRTLTLAAANINNTDVFVQKIDADQNVVETWTKVDSAFGEGVSFDPDLANSKKIFETDTLVNDQVRLRFGDGTFGEIPTGTFRIWARTAIANPTKIRTNTIQNKAIVLPYVGADSQVYYLRIAFSLVRDLDNAAPSESNDDIKTRANKVFYTQNRMVTGQDYNNWFLNDNAIRKVHVVNRTYAGHSRYSKLHDPTGLYENVREIGRDGRLFQKSTLNHTYVSADETRVANKVVIDYYMKPLLEKADKRELYYGRYNELFFPTAIEYRWSLTNQVGVQSLGNIKRGSTIVPVGPTASSLRYFGTDSVFRYDSPIGPVAHVIRVTGDGTGTDAIILGETVPNTSKLYSVFPAFRVHLTATEESEIYTRLADRSNFGLGWHLLNQAWTVIDFNNLDTTSEFSLDDQGDTSNSFADASWMIRFEYVADSVNGDRWKIVDRGLGMFFESARDLNFYFINTESVVDSNTGLVQHDTIQILGSNEAKDSLRRRGLTPIGEQPCELNAYEFVGDATTTCFRTSETLDPEKIIVSVNGVYKVYTVDYTITHSIYGDEICFNVAPPANADIVIRVSGDLIPASVRVFSYLVSGSPTTTFDLYQPNIVPPNMFVFVEGILQNPSLNFGVGTYGTNASLVMADPIAVGLRVTTHYAGNIDSNVFTITNEVGDGVEDDFIIPTTDQTMDTVLVTYDGVVQEMTSYTLTPDVSGTLVHFTTVPPVGVQIGIWSITNTILSSTKRYDFTADGVEVDFELSDFTTLAQDNMMVFVQGVFQRGPYSGDLAYTITSGNTVTFGTAPPAGPVSVYVLAGFSGVLTNPRNRTLLLPTPQNLGPISQNGCHIRWVGDDIDMWVSGELYHDDGYVNSRGILVSPSDIDQDGFADNPFVYRDLVIQDGYTDLVLWRRVQELGKDVWSPIDLLTSPKGSYGRSSAGAVEEGDALTTSNADGDIHYDYTTDKWLVANGLTQVWDEAENQTLFQKAVGRDHLKFIWYHYSPDSRRIDPSPSNIHDAYLLTTTYNQAYRDWLRQNGTSDTEPDAPTPEELRIQFADHTQFKMLSDTIIFHTTRFKTLFGPQAIPELQAIFKVIPMPGSKIGDNQLRTKILSVIDDYFDISRWDFGESFYFTELCAFIHSEMASLIQSIVIVPRANGQAFGKLFQVRSLTDELFVSAAQIEDIEIVSSFTDAELQIGTLT